MGSEIQGSESIPYHQMQVGLRYIVVIPSDDGTFSTGDHVVQLADGDIVCREANGWIESRDVPEAAKSMTVVLDKAWARDQLRSLELQAKTIRHQYSIQEEL
jgi:hypothetical protein